MIGQGLADAYSQEYLNVPLDEAMSYYKRQDFQELTSELRQLRVNYYVTADLAIEQNQAADYTVFLVAAVDENKNLQIRNVIRERMDGREIVDTLISLQKHYNPEFVGIEEMQVSKAIGPFLREEMIKTNVYLNLVQLKHGGKDKTARSRSMQARMRTQSVYFEKKAEWYQGFEDELTRFPRDTHDDQFDAFSYLGILLDKIIEAPTVAEIEEEEYYEEFGDELEQGRSALTGY
jgi:predicted phage terminase large subunit-like protein